MLLSNTITVIWSSGMAKSLKRMGYNASLGEAVEVKIADLPLGSNILIDMKCDICGKPYKQRYYEAKGHFEFSRCGSCHHEFMANYTPKFPKRTYRQNMRCMREV